MQSTLGASLLSCFGYRLGYPRGAHPLTQVSAVHSNGWTALHWAVNCGNRRIVRKLHDTNADVNAQDDYDG